MVTQSWPWGSQIAVKKMYPSKHLSWWIRLEDIFRLRLQKTSWSRRIYSPYSYVFRRRLGQDQYFRLGHTSSRRFQDLVKTPCQDVFKTSCKSVFKTSSRHLANTSSRHIAKTSSGHLQDFFKTFWRRPQEVFKTSCKDVFQTFSRRIIKLKCSCKQVFETHSTRF